MQNLPNNCRMGKMSVFPKNWKTATANHKLIWRITYWFYDDSLNKKKQIVIKGMNDRETLADKQLLIKSALKDELTALQNGHNPITGKGYCEVETNYEIDSSTPFIEALNFAREKINTCMIDLKSVIKYVEVAAKELKMDKLPVGSIKRKHIKIILEHLPKVKKYWSANTFNYYRAHLIMLFNELIEFEAIEYHPVKDISKMTNTVRIRETLSKEERRRVDLHLRKKGLRNKDVKKRMMRFRLYIKLFFHSGIRSTEMLSLKGKDISLKNQTIKCLIKKGRANIEKEKTIKNIAVRYWKLALKDCGPEDYIFSRGLKPGVNSIRPDQITHRWNEHIKKDLKITSDFYALKHGNTTEMVDLIGVKGAAELSSHNTTAMVRTIYDTKRVSREHESIKGVKNYY